MSEEDKENYKKYNLLFLVLVLLVANIYIIYLNWQFSQRGLTMVMLDVGQGDAILLESPTGSQILIDGGTQNKILSKLQKFIPFFDKKIDAIVVTNPDQDHIGGFLDVLKVYKVEQVLEAGTFNESKTYLNLENKIKEKNIPKVLAKRGMRIDMGGGAVLEILFPDRDVTDWTTNDGSVVGKLSYGNTEIILMGDATKETERILLAENSKEILDSDIIKIGHHGSKTSSSHEFLEAVSPAFALISNGLNNKYGHPHNETLSTLESLGVKVLRTDILGSIVMKSDGETATFSYKK
jgi:competence protein ComEC